MPIMRRQRVKRNHLPRRSSPKGIKARMARRERGYQDNKSNSDFHKPGSMNPRKVGR